MTMMNQTSSKNLLLCLLLYLIREDEVKTIHRSACPLVSPKAFLCIISDIEDCAADDSEKMFMCGSFRVVFLPVCVFKKPHQRSSKKSLSKFQFSSFSFASSFFFFSSLLFLLFFGEKVSSEKIYIYTKRGERNETNAKTTAHQ